MLVGERKDQTKWQHGIYERVCVYVAMCECTNIRTNGGPNFVPSNRFPHAQTAMKHLSVLLSSERFKVQQTTNFIVWIQTTGKPFVSARHATIPHTVIRIYQFQDIRNCVGRQRFRCVDQNCNNESRPMETLNSGTHRH